MDNYESNINKLTIFQDKYRLCISFSVNSVTDPFNNPDNTLNILHSQIQSAILPILVCLHQNC